MSKGQSQPEIVCGRLCISLHGSGSTILVPGFDCDASEFFLFVLRGGGDDEECGGAEADAPGQV